MGYTPPSPKGRTIEHVEGNPDSIIERGDQITELGRQMLDSADLLESIATRALEDGTQKGQAIEALKESIGDSYKTLRESGELYEPVGPVIAGYGDALKVDQPRINGSADDCEELWNTYMSLPGNKDGSQEVEEGGVLGLGGTDEDEAANNAAKLQAYQAWEEEAERFDTYYDSWESAFEDAANGIGEEMSGAIEDSFWSDVVDVLKVVGTIVAIAALFTGIGALIWAGVAIGGLLTLATLGQMANGEADWVDLGLAAVSMIPVTKVGKVAAGGSGAVLGGMKGGAAAFMKGLVPRTTNLTRMTDDGIIMAFRNQGGMSGVARLLGTGNARGMAGYMDDAMRVTGNVPTSMNQVVNLADMTRIQSAAGGIGTLNGFNSWAGDLGLPNLDVPREVGFGF